LTALKLKNVFFPACLLKGDALQRLGRFSEAISCFEKSIQIDSNDGVKAFAAIAACHFEMKDAKAAEFAGIALTHQPDHLGCLQIKAHCLLSEGKFEDALSEIRGLEKSLSISFSISMFRKQQKFEEAFSVLEEFKAKSQYASVDAHLAAIHLEMGNYAEAESTLFERLSV
jgi:tetratricopeptide (TPR) repeat protein